MLSGKSELRVLFIGCVEASKIFLEVLLKYKVNIVGVVTKKESNFNADFVDLAPICEKNHIKYRYTKNINEMGIIEFIYELEPDLGFCLGWSQLIGREVLKLFPRGVIGFHPAMLPQNKGRHPIIWALALGLSETASSFFMLDDGADTGAVVSQIRVSIRYEDTARTLYDKIMGVAQAQLIVLWEQICEGNVCIIDGDGQKGNTWRKRNKNDGKIDWRMSSTNIYNLVRALSEPYVGAHFEYDNKEYKIWAVRELLDEGYENIEPGKVISILEDGRFSVKSGKGVVEVVRYDERFKPKYGTYL